MFEPASLVFEAGAVAITQGKRLSPVDSHQNRPVQSTNGAFGITVLHQIHLILLADK